MSDIIFESERQDKVGLIPLVEFEKAFNSHHGNLSMKYYQNPL